MTTLHFNVSKFPDKPPEADPGSFAARAPSVDLFALIDQGIPPLDYLPASDGMLVRGSKHYIAAPAKTGKSMGMLVHAVDMMLDGARVTILDRENGQHTYARRLKDICEARKLDQGQEDTLRDRLLYLPFSHLKRDDGADMVEAFRGRDLVIFDSSRMFLSDLGLDEDQSNDYAQFMAALIDPLFAEGIATLILDNTGHSNPKRPRGSSAKGDLNEIIFSMGGEPFSLTQKGRLSLEVEFSRFGNRGEWSMELGAGTYGSFAAGKKKEWPGFREAVLAVLADGAPRGEDKLLTACRLQPGTVPGTPKARVLLAEYVSEGLLRRDNAGFSRVEK